MNVKMQAYDGQGIVYIRNQGVNVTADIHQFNEIILALLKNNAHQTLHIVIDSREVSQPFSNLLKIKQSITFTHEPNLGHIVVIDTIGGLGAVLSQAAGKILNLDLHVVPDEEQAQKVLHRIDPSLPWTGFIGR